jgi:uncharacterized protein (TIGR00725 family)
MKDWRGDRVPGGFSSDRVKRPVALRPMLAVVGSGQASRDLAALAERAGRAVLDAGFHLACGGLGGVMEAACRGARQSPRHGECLILGILPGADRSLANEHCDLAVATGMGVARNAILVTTADAVLALGGGAGTLSEVALAWQLGKPVAVVASSGGWAGKLGDRPIDDRRPGRVLEASTPEEAVRMLKEALAGCGAGA